MGSFRNRQSEEPLIVTSSISAKAFLVAPSLPLLDRNMTEILKRGSFPTNREMPSRVLAARL